MTLKGTKIISLRQVNNFNERYKSATAKPTKVTFLFTLDLNRGMLKRSRVISSHWQTFIESIVMSEFGSF